MFINNVIPNNLLYLLNIEHQRNNAWVTYINMDNNNTDKANIKKSKNNIFQVVSFYSRIYQLL